MDLLESCNCWHRKPSLALHGSIAHLAILAANKKNVKIIFKSQNKGSPSDNIDRHQINIMSQDCRGIDI